jgi:glutaconyl-CoA decarboxylase
MKPYFQKMSPMGKALRDKERTEGEPNALEMSKIEKEVQEAVEKRQLTGIPVEKIHKRGEKTAWERIDLLVDPGTFLPLNTLYDPEFNQEGTTGVVTGLGQISGRYASIIASDNKVLAGA